MDDAGMTKADRELLAAAASGEGLIPVTPEILAGLAAMARVTKAGADVEFESMTMEQAALARRLRVDEDYTWRAVAETCALEWGGDWGSNQLYGMAICERAAALHGENYMADPWN